MVVHFKDLPFADVYFNKMNKKFIDKLTTGFKLWRMNLQEQPISNMAAVIFLTFIIVYLIRL